LISFLEKKSKGYDKNASGSNRTQAYFVDKEYDAWKTKKQKALKDSMNNVKEKNNEYDFFSQKKIEGLQEDILNRIEGVSNKEAAMKNGLDVNEVSLSAVRDEILGRIKFNELIRSRFNEEVKGGDFGKLLSETKSLIFEDLAGKEPSEFENKVSSELKEKLNEKHLGYRLMGLCDYLLYKYESKKIEIEQQMGVLSSKDEDNIKRVLINAIDGEMLSLEKMKENTKFDTFIEFIENPDEKANSDGGDNPYPKLVQASSYKADIKDTDKVLFVKAVVFLALAGYLNSITEKVNKYVRASVKNHFERFKISADALLLSEETKREIKGTLWDKIEANPQLLNEAQKVERGYYYLLRPEKSTEENSQQNKTTSGKKPKVQERLPKKRSSQSKRIKGKVETVKKNQNNPDLTHHAIISADGTTYLAHHNASDFHEMKKLSKGIDVTFEVGEHDGKPVAINVHVLES